MWAQTTNVGRRQHGFAMVTRFAGQAQVQLRFASQFEGSAKQYIRDRLANRAGVRSGPGFVFDGHQHEGLRVRPRPRTCFNPTLIIEQVSNHGEVLTPRVNQVDFRKLSGWFTRDRKRNEHDTYAPPWWERFHFRLNRRLVDDNDSSYFGAIYELKNAPPCAPKYVIAFRGTIKRFQTIFEDMKLNFKFFFGHPKKRPRFQIAFKAVLEIVTMAGAENVWLAGHSLDASIAMLVGRELVKTKR
ncbi:hypothetical protein E3N88_23501 [Mikania micrantha]|uniref:Fungal lipase-like domain-containing protein n=1 Tax=Mikania micrantha TaxID=192012 RepID=A0A5N6NF39_9ASTR|nr:hypothetical protein E3N88_23501 [Mikania micrantha]